MSVKKIQQPFDFYHDDSGNALKNGKVYFGIAGQDPETNPITVYWDSSLTTPASQPIRTLNGYLSNNGNIGNLYISSEYSITVRDKNDNLIFTQLTSKFVDTQTIDVVGEYIAAGQDFSDVITFLNANSGTTYDLVFEGQTVTLDSSVTIPSNVRKLIFGPDGSITFSTYDLTLSSQFIDAPTSEQIFIYNSTGKLEGTVSNYEIYTEWFGAQGDGVTNDSTSINYALNFLFPTGGIVKFLAKTYVIRETILLKQSIILQGVPSPAPFSPTNNGGTVFLSDNTVTSVLTSGKYSYALFSLEGDGTDYLQNCTLRDFTVISGFDDWVPDLVDMSDRVAVQVYKRQHLIMHNVMISGFKQGAYYAFESFDNYFLDCFWRRCGDKTGNYTIVMTSGASNKSSNAHHWTNCRFENSFAMFKIDNGLTDGSTSFTNCKFESLEIDQDATNPMFNFVSCGDVKFSSCSFQFRALTNNPYIMTGGVLALRLYFIGCHFYGKDTNWIDFSDLPRSTITGCVFQDSNVLDYPIKLGRASIFTDNKIVQNLTGETTRYGIQLNWKSIVKNVFFEEEGTGGTITTGVMMKTINAVGSEITGILIDGPYNDFLDTSVSDTSYANIRAELAGVGTRETSDTSAFVSIDGVKTLIYDNLSADLTITRFQHGYNGQEFSIYNNDTTYSVTIAHDGNRIFTSTGADYVLTPLKSIKFEYFGSYRSKETSRL